MQQIPQNEGSQGPVANNPLAPHLCIAGISVTVAEAEPGGTYKPLIFDGVNDTYMDIDRLKFKNLAEAKTFMEAVKAGFRDYIKKVLEAQNVGTDNQYN